MRRIGRLARWLVRLELGIWRSLFLWVTRRVPGRGPDTQAFPYAKEVTPLLLALTWGSLLEVVVVHLLLPWETVRLVALVIGLWGLLWMAGYLASMRVHQHLVGPDGLLVRSGTTVAVPIPWDALGRIRADRARVPKERAAGVTYVDQLNQTRVTVELRRPLVVGEDEVREVRFSADDPQALVAAVVARLPDEALLTG